MSVSFTEEAIEVFGSLPRKVQLKATRVIELAAVFPKLFPYRRKGIMSGFRCFTVSKYRFFYRSSDGEVMVVAIVPAMMRRA